MARPKEFDRDEVLDRAVQLFWSRGYERTSVQDLVDSMGIQRGSLYATFGDKRQLFLAALDRYEESFHRTLQDRLAHADSARDGIRRVFEQVLEDCACGDRTGCFMTNTAVGLSSADSETASRIRANLSRLEETFRETLEKARSRGELEPGMEPLPLARFFTNALQGLRVLSKCSMELSVLRDVIDVTLCVLDPIGSEAGALSRKETL